MADELPLVLDAERDRVALIRLRAAVRADAGRSAMIYAAADLATWIGRSMARRGLRIEVAAAGDGLIISGADPAALACVRRAISSGAFDAA